MRGPLSLRLLLLLLFLLSILLLSILYPPPPPCSSLSSSCFLSSSYSFSSSASSFTFFLPDPFLLFLFLPNLRLLLHPLPLPVCLRGPPLHLLPRSPLIPPPVSRSDNKKRGSASPFRFSCRNPFLTVTPQAKAKGRDHEKKKTRKNPIRSLPKRETCLLVLVDWDKKKTSVCPFAERGDTITKMPWKY